jgi:signal transduction histidine kinase
MHELRTPLTNIRSWLEAAEDGLATPTSDPALTAAGGLRPYPQPARLGDILD